MKKFTRWNPYWDLHLTMENICSSSDTRVKLIAVYPVHKYVDGKKTAEVEGYKYQAELPYVKTKNGDNKFTYVKIFGECLITPKEIKEKAPLVIFENTKVVLYKDAEGECTESITASGMKVEGGNNV
ncbi:MAG: hypothetical protein IKB01_10930 [Lachnospiraceae bacterium]|nr:hypothetical protein [Lachnospiraceae bacterium]